MLKKTFENFPSAQPSHLLLVKHITILYIHLMQQSLELTVTKSLGVYIVDSRDNIAHHILKSD